MPQVIANKRKWKEAIEDLEFSRELAKQVPSQLSYTPTVGTSFDSKGFAAVGKLRNAVVLPIEQLRRELRAGGMRFAGR